MTSRLLLPLLSVWSIAAYIHLLHYLHVFEIVRSRLWVSVMFLPALGLEFFFSLRFPHGMGLGEITGGWIFLFVCKSVFWLLCFSVWVPFMGVAAQKAMIIKWFVTKIYQSVWLVGKAEGWITIIPAALWVTLYYLVTVEGGMFRIFTSLVLPILLSVMLMFHLYVLGGRGGLRKGKVFRQQGVEREFRVERIGQYRVPNHPRGIYYDPKGHALFVMFGRTYGRNEIYPTIIRRDMQTGNMHCFLSRNIRRVSFDAASRSIFVAPWYEKSYFHLSMKDLRIIHRWDSQVEGILQTWEPMDIVKDVSSDRVYIGNDAEQALISYKNSTGEREGILNLLEQGLVGVGGPLWNLVQSTKTRRLYFTSGPGRRRFYDNHLFEVDPDSLTISRTRKFFDVVGTALDLDEENDRIFYQNGCFRQLHEIDLKTFEIKRTYKGEGHARRIRLDRKRNCLYVLGYFSGTLFPLDLETGKRPWTLHVGGLPEGMHLHEDTLWVNSMAGILRIDLNVVWGDREGHDDKTPDLAPQSAGGQTGL